MTAGSAQETTESSAQRPARSPQVSAHQESGVTLISDRPGTQGQQRAEVQPVRRYSRSAESTSSRTEKLSSGAADVSQKNPAAGQARSIEPGIRNFHQELFGDQAPSAAAASGRPARVPAEKSAADARPQNLKSVRLADSAKNPAQTSAATAPDESRPVVSADYATTLQHEPVVPVSARRSSETASQKLELPELKPASAGTDTAPLALKNLPAAQNGLSATQLKQGPAAVRRVTNFTKKSPEIQLRWSRRGDINVGHESRLELTVSNTGQAAAFDMEVDAVFPETVRLIEAVPRPDSATDCVTWRLPSLEAGEERRFEVAVIPLQSGEVAANANVRFTSAATTVFQVEEPLLTLAVSGPEQVSLGEPATHIVTIANPGTGVARNVRVTVSLPAGLEHVSRRDRLMMELGSLSPGEKRDVRLSLTAVRGGEQSVVVDADAGSELKQQSTSVVSVLSPKMELAVTGPGLRYIGRDARYTLKVVNSGAATTNNVRAMYAVPPGFEFQSVSRGGKYDAETRIVSWFVGSLQPQGAVDLNVQLRPMKLGEFVHAARVVTERGDVVEAQAETRIEGTASLVLKVDDLDDPVEIGRETACEITVRNDGSKAAQTVGLSIELPAGVRLLDVKGPTSHISESGLVVFKSMPVLPAGRTATYRIFVQGMQAGHQRIRVRLTSDSIQEPLTVEELTRFYAD